MVESKPIKKLVKFSDFNEFGVEPKIEVGENAEDNIDL